MFELEITNKSDLNNTEDKAFASERFGMLKKIIESLYDIAEQIEIKASDKGLTIQVMDLLHVTLADIFLSRDIFSSYRCDRDLTLGLPVKQLVAVLRGIVLDESSLVRFSAEDSPTSLKIEHIMHDSRYDCNIILYQIGSDNYQLPEIEYGCMARMPTEKFRSITKVIGSFGEYISMRCEKDSFIFKQTADLTKNSMVLKSNGESVIVECAEPTEVEVAMKYINMISKVSSLTNEIQINLGESAPAFISIRLYDVLGHIKYYIAPKVDD